MTQLATVPGSDRYFRLVRGEPRVPGFRAEMVVDRLDVEITVDQTTNFQTIQSRCGSNPSGRPRYVEALDPGSGGAAKAFLIRFNAPASWEPVRNALVAVHRDFTLTDTPAVTRLELALDFYHRTNDPEALQAMTLRLMRSIFGDGRDSRMAWGEGKGNGDFVRPDKPLRPWHDMYVGNQFDEVSWHVYWKRTDDNKQPIPPGQHRARCEAVLQGPLARIHAVIADDLSAMRLTDVAQYFKFLQLRPVPDPDKPGYAIRRLIHAVNFERMGVVGVIADRDRRRKYPRKLTADGTLKSIAHDCFRNLAKQFDDRFSR